MGDSPTLPDQKKREILEVRGRREEKKGEEEERREKGKEVGKGIGITCPVKLFE